MTAHPTLNLHGYTYAELFHSAGLMRLDQAFLAKLQAEYPLLQAGLLAYREGISTANSQETSELLINCATYLEKFLAQLFGIEEAVAISQAKTTLHNPVSIFKKYFVLRRAKKELLRVENFPSFEQLDAWLQAELKKAPLTTPDTELAVALLGTQYLDQVDRYAADIEKLVQWCARALTDKQGLTRIATWVSFAIPERLEYANLVPITPVDDASGRLSAPENTWRLRNGFKLTDERMSARHVQDEVNYCIYCHDHDGDFCSKGFPVKKGDPAQGFKKNPLEVTLTGCPLEEKISEMHFLKKEGFTLGSLAMVMIDNPMCPATGHRICNECMKACIYQKQDPVNIPQIETRVLTDVLALPWGVEIYDLLTRWNPLRQQQWVMKPYNGLKIMIAGMGPAGFTLAHHLLLEGFAVVGFDGLKIEPLPEALLTQPIYAYDDLIESLDERLMAGFGGVAEYGITVRWDKNFLKLIYLSLMRRPTFQVFGGIRFGGTITVEDAWDMGFDHFVVAVGAGLPKALSIPGSMAPGMRQANDFLMALQLGNAAKASSLTNLQVRLPAVVIGGGLTGVDTATEIQAYYITQVEKIAKRHALLAKKHGEEVLRQELDAASQEILAEYLAHGKALQAERERAKQQGVPPNFIKLVQAWGGVTIVYRRSLQESPAYINNHEELKKALEEGIYYIEGIEPRAVQLDQHGHAAALIGELRIKNDDKEWVNSEQEVCLPARSILVATGTQPNTAYEFEHRGTFNRVKLQYQHYEDEAGELKLAADIAHCKEKTFGPFTSYRKDHRRVSLIGDTHPVFHGSVVKAIASGLHTYPKIVALLKNQLGQHGSDAEYQSFAAHMQQLMNAKIIDIVRKTEHIIELTIAAPLAAKHFEPGQFYRLQNFETLAHHADDTLLLMEPLALVAAECDRQAGTLTFIVNEKNSVSAKLCATLKRGESVSLMGPTGVRAKMPKKRETVLIIGNQASFAFLRSYGVALRAAGHQVLYVGQFSEPSEVYCQDQLEQAADVILWLTAKGIITPHRAHDMALTGTDVIAALLAYQQGKLNTAVTLPLTTVNRIFLVGDANLLRQFQAARQGALKPYLNQQPKVFGSVYSNMQCMLKGVCAQCLQWQIDPETGERTKAVFACSWQDQPLELIDIDHVAARHSQNSLHEKISTLWVQHVFATQDVPRI